MGETGETKQNKNNIKKEEEQTTRNLKRKINKTPKPKKKGRAWKRVLAQVAPRLCPANQVSLELEIQPCASAWDTAPWRCDAMDFFSGGPKGETQSPKGEAPGGTNLPKRYRGGRLKRMVLKWLQQPVHGVSPCGTRRAWATVEFTIAGFSGLKLRGSS